jgi:hypothetical protein
MCFGHACACLGPILEFAAKGLGSRQAAAGTKPAVVAGAPQSGSGGQSIIILATRSTQHGWSQTCSAMMPVRLPTGLFFRNKVRLLLRELESDIFLVDRRTNRNIRASSPAHSKHKTRGKLQTTSVSKNILFLCCESSETRSHETLKLRARLVPLLMLVEM